MKLNHNLARALLVLALLLAMSTSVASLAAAAPTAPTFTVNSFADPNPPITSGSLTNGVCETATGNGTCTLRAAIMKANHYAGGGVTINMPTAGTYTLAIAPSGTDDELTGNLNITNTMTINNSSAASTIIDANQIDRVFFVGTSVTVTISNVTISNGKSDFGGGIANLGNLTLNSSTINNNTATNGGGGIGNEGTLTLINSTVSNNSTPSHGGGIYNYSAAASTNASYSTIVGNLADSDANGSGTGGGINNSGGTVNLKGVLLGQNYTAATANDCFGGITSFIFTKAETTSCTGIASGDAFVDSLKNNGGPTPTRALLAGSPAINGGESVSCTTISGAPLTTDQRGVTRVAPCDIGAYEGSVPTPIYNRNLIRNGDAEAMAGSPTGATVGMPNWTRTFSSTIVPYGAPGGFPIVTDPGPADRGYGFFAGGGTAKSYFTEIIDLSAIGAAIDAGKVHYDLSGYFGGYANQNDIASAEVGFADQSSVFISGTATIGGFTAANRGNQTKLLYASTSGIVPVTTRYIFVVLLMSRADPSGYNDGYADNLSFVLRPPTLYLPLILR